MKISVVIRTYNEERHLRQLLSGIEAQLTPDHTVETVIVDSGSTDDTLKIASEFSVRIVPIRKEDFSFGRSLNVGCTAATGDLLVFVSGHCIPAGRHWLDKLVQPLIEQGGTIGYVYGGQWGDARSRFSEKQIFSKYFPEISKIPQDGFYCNNANAATLRSIWVDHRFDEELTGLEDMHLAKRLVALKYKVAYVADAAVYHLHSEHWKQIRRRFEREAIALQHIMPEIHLSLRDTCRYFFRSVALDFVAARRQRVPLKHFHEIVLYRFNQFLGAYQGNHIHRQLSRQAKEAYYYPQ